MLYDLLWFVEVSSQNHVSFQNELSKFDILAKQYKIQDQSSDVNEKSYDVDNSFSGKVDWNSKDTEEDKKAVSEVDRQGMWNVVENLQKTVVTIQTQVADLQMHSQQQYKVSTIVCKS